MDKISVLRVRPRGLAVDAVGAETIAAARRYLGRVATSLRGNLAGNICWNCADRFLNLVLLFCSVFQEASNGPEKCSRRRHFRRANGVE
jgi:hypothetical protein